MLEQPRSLFDRAAFAAIWLFVASIPVEKTLEIPGLGTVSRIAGLLAAALGLLAIAVSRKIRRPDFALILSVCWVVWVGLTSYWSLVPAETAEKLSTYSQLLVTSILLRQFCTEPAHVRSLLIAYSVGIACGVGNTVFRWLTGAGQVYYQRYAVEGFDPNDLALTLAIGVPFLYWLSLTSTSAFAAWTWRLLPDNPVVCFAEIWIAGRAETPTVTLTAPSGATASAGASVPASRASAPTFRICGPVEHGTDTLWLLAVEATRGEAEHGDWRITVSGLADGTELHAYAARSDPNMGARTGAKRSYFRDDAWEADRAAEAGLTYAAGMFDGAGSLVERSGTLNGIATAQADGLHVAGGYIVANRRPSPYASAGPARPGPLACGPFGLGSCAVAAALAACGPT